MDIAIKNIVIAGVDCITEYEPVNNGLISGGNIVQHRILASGQGERPCSP